MLTSIGPAPDGGALDLDLDCFNGAIGAPGTKHPVTISPDWQVITPHDVEAERIAELSSLPIAELWPVWDRYFSSRPINPNRVFIESRIAYKMQEEAFGGLSNNTRQRLEAIGAKHSKIKLRARPRDINFAPGTVLLREWGEREHKVVVTADGLFEYEGSTFKSLTAVARQITGTHWSGPLFFGLNGKAGAQ